MKGKILPDGTIIESVAVGGEVIVVQKEAQFLRDIFPYFAASWTIIVVYGVFYYTRNVMLPIWMLIL